MEPSRDPSMEPHAELEPLGDHDPRDAGPFYLRGRLRVGRVGRVFLGRSPDGRFAEVTVVDPQLAWEPRVLSLLTDGVEATRPVRVPHVQRLRGADLRARAPWFAVDLLPGPSLREAVERHGPLPPAVVRHLAVALAGALEAVHAAGLVHRALDPQAVVLTADGPVVTGLGVARALEETSVTLPRLVPDAVGYVSPEVVRGYEPGAPADVFGLGAVLAYAATGRGPFGTGASGDLARRVHQDDPDLAYLPGDLVETVAACVRAAPGERPTAAALRRRLSAGTPGAWDLPAGLTAELGRWEVLGRGRSAPLPPALGADPTERLVPEAPAPAPGSFAPQEPGGPGSAGPTDRLDGPAPGAGAAAPVSRPVSIVPRSEDRADAGPRRPATLAVLLMVLAGVAVAGLTFAAVALGR